ncbi:Inositol 3-kinase [Hibiscus syriacus]|uniref:Inositol 3-kinase n=1 Tax=Hibiscus syriacus TaxID=106335 RepID=A0A6A3C8S4_HIBSY|nr:inositol 3-kinase-like [Hibiscus syriacus]KAE8725553.1 Inositol 3-kinase [Hibiscus syriacus]
MVTTTIPQPQNTLIQSVLIVGNYCHDVLLHDGAVVAETLGGASSFISNVFTALSVSSHLTSKVGFDFKYPVNHDPIVIPTSKSTVFHAYFGQGHTDNAHQDRVLKRVEVCDPINPSDLPDKRFDFGMAVGVGGEILPETLEKMVETCDAVFVDIQALIRSFDKNDGTVKLVGLKESGFYHLLPRVKFLKASSEEALFMDLEKVRQWCCVVITRGKDGCEVFWKDGEMKIEPFGANQVDPTGAGDSFLGGFVGGLVHGLVVPDAALVGNLFGSLTVGQIGLPKFDLRLLQRVKDEVQRRKLHNTCGFESEDDSISFMKPAGHDKFHASLASTKLVSTCSIQECLQEVPRSPGSVQQAIRPPCNGQQKLLLGSVYDKPI